MLVLVMLSAPRIRNAQAGLVVLSYNPPFMRRLVGLRHRYVDRIQTVNAEGSVGDRPGERDVETNLARLGGSGVPGLTGLGQLAGKRGHAVSAARACLAV